MTADHADQPLLRTRTGKHAPVGYVELFFDLVFVFAVTQLSHSLIAHPTLTGLMHTAMLLGAVWWVWIDTAWATNWLDVDKPLVRTMMFLLMAAGLVMSSALPDAFEARGMAFGLALGVIQIGRTGFVLWAVRGDPVLRGNFQRILVWHGGAALLWIAGGLASPETRPWVWLAALAIDSIGPAMSFRFPGLGKSNTGDWTVEGGHLSERLSLFTIIALGESILVMGATAAELPWTPAVILAFVSAFLGSVAMWWIYFAASARAASDTISHSADPGRLARLSYTYVHIIPIAGIIVTAVGDEWALAHPMGHADVKMALAVVGGPALFLLGTLLFKYSIFGRVSPTRLTGLVLMAGLGAVSLMLSPLLLAVGSTAVLILVAAMETVMIARGQSERG
jgi:low temperature requirement protein LtrA